MKVCEDWGHSIEFQYTIKYNKIKKFHVFIRKDLMIYEMDEITFDFDFDIDFSSVLGCRFGI